MAQKSCQVSWQWRREKPAVYHVHVLDRDHSVIYNKSYIAAVPKAKALFEALFALYWMYDNAAVLEMTRRSENICASNKASILKWSTKRTFRMFSRFIWERIWNDGVYIHFIVLFTFGLRKNDCSTLLYIERSLNINSQCGQ